LRLKPRLATLLVTAVGVTALFGLTSSAALAEVHWNVGTTLSHWKGTLKVEAEGSSVTCSNLDLRISTFNNGGGSAEYKMYPSGIPVNFSCAGGTTMELVHKGNGSLSGVTYWLSMAAATGFWLESPYGLYFANPLPNNPPKLVFTNGSGITPSQVTFSGAEIGEVDETGATMFLSGTLTVTTATGGLLTLST
jgi:hypothetical protein